MVFLSPGCLRVPWGGGGVGVKIYGSPISEQLSQRFQASAVFQTPCVILIWSQGGKPLNGVWSPSTPNQGFMLWVLILCPSWCQAWGIHRSVTWTIQELSVWTAYSGVGYPFFLEGEAEEKIEFRLPAESNICNVSRIAVFCFITSMGCQEILKERSTDSQKRPVNLRLWRICHQISQLWHEWGKRWSQMACGSRAPAPREKESKWTSTPPATWVLGKHKGKKRNPSTIATKI